MTQHTCAKCGAKYTSFLCETCVRISAAAPSMLQALRDVSRRLDGVHLNGKRPHPTDVSGARQIAADIRANVRAVLAEIDQPERPE